MSGFKCNAPADLVGIIPKKGFFLLELERASLGELVELVMRKTQLRDL